jgi:hypothetical protein
MTKILFSLLLIFTISYTQTLTIKKNGSQKKLELTENKGTYTIKNGKFFKSSTRLIVKFKQEIPELISEFEQRYNLTLDRVLITGNYIYSHKTDIISLLEEVATEPNLTRAEPLFKKRALVY